MQAREVVDMNRSLGRPAAWLILACIVVATASCGRDSGTESSDPSLPTEDGSYDPQLVARGEELYGQTCTTCHGVDLKGTKKGPPFLNVIYAPNHHPDEAFFAAVAGGVQPHHWKSGPMPPQPEVSPEEVEAIIAYIRTKQVEAGIMEDPSHP
jgi:mono/diheme cytochrome c family protein